MNASRTPARRAALAAVAATAAVSLAACGDNGSSTGQSASPTVSASSSAGAPAPSGTHNAADVSFAKGMIPHHRQAVQMAEMAGSHGASPQVEDLAGKIKKAQGPEIKTMSGWLEAWGEKVPEDMDGMGGMDHGGSSPMPGMMGMHEMGELKKSSGHAFDTMFLTMMVKHHQGAVQMATTEQKSGAYGPARKLAQDIITSQNAEISQMQQMLGNKK
ncbi:copper resistance protein [Streptomyces sp. NRRL F-5755]|uniref:DUF305 domain-containing protein n=1 Tax=Streptomyces sp. NRRL F-5755 TaxID=1519475 RepID=UPI0006AF6D6B|nr:DUF305 domain-containing protein [Streptomyces sp. NRRL F-5755]KOT89949.1 copper resistance protein [Streptomyces sp. NRRL F-5755]